MSRDERAAHPLGEKARALQRAIRILSRWLKESLIKTQEEVIAILNRQEPGRLLGSG